MKFLVLLSLSFLPSSLSLAVHARQENNSTIPTTTTNPTSTSLPIIPAPPGNTQADVITNCARWDFIASPGPRSCSGFMSLYPGLSFSDLTLWNPSVGPACDGMWDNYLFCTAIAGEYVPRPVNTPAGVPIKSPIKPQPENPHPENCDRFDVIPFGARCQTFLSRYPGLSVANIQKWNPLVVKTADPCWLNFDNDLCTSVVGHVFPVPDPVPPYPTPTGAPPPGPTQSGVTTACQKWDVVEYGETCDTYVVKYGVSLEQLVQWNPAVGETCATLWGGYAVCVGV